MGDGMKLADAAIGEPVIMVENMDGQEVRWTVYQRRQGEAQYRGNVPVYRIRTIQGVLGLPPRYEREGAAGYPSEAHGAIPVLPFMAWPITEGAKA